MVRPKPILEPLEACELASLNALILRSKAYWGYDEAFMQACKAELEVTVDLLAQNQFVTARVNGNTAGMAEVSIASDTAYLEKLFVDPDYMSVGAGRLLFNWAIRAAKKSGASRIVIEADPGAEPFYVKMGAKRVRMTPSGSIPGRFLPELELQMD